MHYSSRWLYVGRRGPTLKRGKSLQSIRHVALSSATCGPAAQPLLGYQKGTPSPGASVQSCALSSWDETSQTGQNRPIGASRQCDPSALHSLAKIGGLRFFNDSGRSKPLPQRTQRKPQSSPSNSAHVTLSRLRPGVTIAQVVMHRRGDDQRQCH
jgi:hypothetical protein